MSEFEEVTASDADLVLRIEELKGKMGLDYLSDSRKQLLNLEIGHIAWELHQRNLEFPEEVA